MASSNTPLLLKIIEKIDNLDARVTSMDVRFTQSISTLTTRIDKLENTVNTIQSYIHTESFNKENSCTDFIKHYIQNARGSASRVDKITFGDFYTPHSNEPLTDIDGCLILHTQSIHVKNANGRPRNLNFSSTYIVESKHNITMHIIHKKLKQFVQMLDTIHQFQNGTFQLANAKEQFVNMVMLNDMKHFPTPIFFVFGADDIPTHLQEYIHEINEGILEETYMHCAFINIKEHKVTRDIMRDKTIASIFKEHIKNAASIAEIFDVFDETKITKRYRPTKKLQSGLQTIQKYKQKVMELYEPYESMKCTFELLRGRLGYRTSYAAVIPTAEKLYASKSYLEMEPYANTMRKQNVEGCH